MELANKPDGENEAPIRLLSLGLHQGMRVGPYPRLCEAFLRKTDSVGKSMVDG